MFSRVSALAILFAIVMTTSLAVAASVKQHHRAAASAAVPVVQLERVMVIGKRASFN